MRIGVRSKQHSDEAASTGDEIHKTPINMPVRLYEDLKMLVAIEPGASFNAILLRAATEFVEREKETLDQLRRIAAKRAGGKRGK